MTPEFLEFTRTVRECVRSSRGGGADAHHAAADRVLVLLGVIGDSLARQKGIKCRDSSDR